MAQPVRLAGPMLLFLYSSQSPSLKIYSLVGDLSERTAISPVVRHWGAYLRAAPDGPDRESFRVLNCL